MAMPMLLRDALPAGVTGLVLASYFSAVMSTADSCLIAASGNLVNDIIENTRKPFSSPRTAIRISQIGTLIIGGLALVLATAFQTVLEMILYAYSFMVAGLLFPTLGAYFWSKSHPVAAFISMIGGGGLTLFLIISKTDLWMGLDASFFGLGLSALLFISVSMLYNKRSRNA